MKQFFTILLVCLTVSVQAQNQFYHTLLLRAKPGSLLELIEGIKQKAANNTAASGKTYILRHSQGDHWDIMVVYPIKSTEDYFDNYLGKKRGTTKAIVEDYGSAWYDLIAFQEEAFVQGPQVSEFQNVFDSANLFHIEIFTSLPGKQMKLLEEREMENDYLLNIDRKPNLIFTRLFGPSWDTFTIGGYQDMHDFAGPEVSMADEDQAAKAAGFKGVNYIGSYLRSLIAEHNDTLAKKVPID